MTLLGKALVFFNLAFSVLLAAWAFTLYANRIDWTNSKGKPVSATQLAVPPGEFAVRDQQLKELWAEVWPAEAKLRTADAAVQTEDSRRVADRVRYDNEMKHLLGIDPKTADKPVGEVAFVAKDDPKTGQRKGQVQLAKDGSPLLVPAKDRGGNPLMPLSFYNKKDQQTLQSLEVVLQNHTKQIQEACRLTDLITGTKNAAGMQITRGLYQRILDEQGKRSELLAEQKLLRPQLVNTAVELQLLRKRRIALDARIEELKKIGVAAKQ